MKSIEVAPSLLAADFGTLQEEIIAVEKAGADALHLDVMDGSFVPPITFGTNMVKLAAKHSTLHRDVHLMIQRPDDHINQFIDAGAQTLTVHIEACQHIHRTMQSIKEQGVRAGVALNPGTPVELLDPVLDSVDLILVMTVNPGWGGQKFIESCLEKITYLSKKLADKHLDVDIEVDGGVNQTTARQCVSAGARILVAGTYIYGSGDYSNAISSLRS